MGNLSNREKNLIFALSLIVIIFLGVQFLFLPQFNSHNMKKTEYADLMTRKTEVEMRIASEPATRQNYDTSKQEYEQIKTRYPVKMDNEAVDNLVTGVTMRNQLAPLQLEIKDATQLELDKISPETKDTQASSEDKQMSVFYIGTATISLDGTYESLKWLINEVAGIDNLRISRVSIQGAINTGTVTIGTQKITIAFQVSMLEEH